MKTATSLLREIRESDPGGEGDGWGNLVALAAEMDAVGRERTSPIREVFALLGDRWTMLILLALGSGAWRHATLRKIIGALSIEGSISQKMLTSKLRALERDGFVHRRTSPDVPPKVEYRLSSRGDALLEHASTLLEWLKRERVGIEATRASFDAQNN